MVGLLSSIGGILCGAAMAMILTWVINKAFFGWAINIRYPCDVIATPPLWILPSARASRIPPARAIRFD